MSMRPIIRVTFEHHLAIAMDSRTTVCSSVTDGVRVRNPALIGLRRSLHGTSTDGHDGWTSGTCKVFHKLKKRTMGLGGWVQ